MEKLNSQNKKSGGRFLLGMPSLFILFIFLFILVDFLSYSGPLWVLIILGIVALILLFINQKKFVYLISILLLLSDDQSKFVDLGERLVKSIIGYPLAGNTILAYLLVIFLIKMVFDILLKKKFKFSLNIYEQILLAISCLYILAAIIGFSNILLNPIQYSSQLSPIIVIVAGYFLIKTTFRSRDELIKFFKIIILAFTARIFVMTIQFIYSRLGVYAITNQFNYSSTIQFILIPLYFWTGLLIWPRKWRNPLFSRLGLILFIILILFNCYSTGSRYVLLSLGISFALSFFIFAFSLPKFIKIITIFGIIFLILVAGVSIIFPKNFAYFVSRSSHLLDWRLSPTSGTTTIAVREIEAINILGRLYATNSLIWGRGLGDYFTSEYYPIPQIIYEREGRGAYPIEWLEKDHFLRPHHPFIQMLLQFGVGGLLIYLALLFIIFYSFFKRFYRSKNLAIKIIFFSLFLGSFPILTSNWSLATNYLFGLILAISAGCGVFRQDLINGELK
ncbi:MAG: hypothetical protein PHV78_00815 [Patescibacteria group bacterium]|nr:hypothetical protein [Patescibacteria group bacterium]MDD5121290.1 hypothetical protein [Patescibacteria group bacterium]MDD5221720.1 hypothetical protein [Patescibacteria group bacterium]MDD5395791.1 hypothetical protein [Patescibacteria group bacterium]